MQEMQTQIKYQEGKLKEQAHGEVPVLEEKYRKFHYQG